MSSTPDRAMMEDQSGGTPRGPVYLSEPVCLMNFIQQLSDSKRLHHQQACTISCDELKDMSLRSLQEVPPKSLLSPAPFRSTVSQNP